VGWRDEKKLEAFKLLLDPTLPTPEYTQIMKVRKIFKEYVKTPVSAVIDFMGALYRYSIEAIEEKHKTAFSEVLAVKIVVSTPAGSPDTVKSTILRVIFHSENETFDLKISGSYQGRNQSRKPYHRGRSRSLLHPAICRGKSTEAKSKYPTITLVVPS
jgi:hypothetical protein